MPTRRRQPILVLSPVQCPRPCLPSRWRATLCRRVPASATRRAAGSPPRFPRSAERCLGAVAAPAASRARLQSRRRQTEAGRYAGLCECVRGDVGAAALSASESSFGLATASSCVVDVSACAISWWRRCSPLSMLVRCCTCTLRDTPPRAWHATALCALHRFRTLS